LIDFIVYYVACIDYIFSRTRPFEAALLTWQQHFFDEAKRIVEEAEKNGVPLRLLDNRDQDAIAEILADTA
jgi:hypothetical protein